jgi:hypothetical protein
MGINGEITGISESFPEKISTVRLTRMFFFLASTDRFITLKAVIAAISIPASEAAIFLIADSSAAAGRIKINLNQFPHFYSK